MRGGGYNRKARQVGEWSRKLSADSLSGYLPNHLFKRMLSVLVQRGAKTEGSGGGGEI